MGDNMSHSILVLDSGLGGLSICQPILALKQNIQLVYFADDAYFPYGLLASDTLSDRVQDVIAEMLAFHQPDLVILACNTVSTLLLPALRAKFDIPFVGVVPAIKPAARQSTTKKIGLLATPATVNREYTDDLIRDHAGDCEVVRVGSSELVLQAERLLAGEGVDSALIEVVVSEFIEPDNGVQVDTVVLGCTHFPFLKSELEKVLPGINWVDSGSAIANRVLDLLSRKEGRNSEIFKGAHQIYFSKNKPDEHTLSTVLRNVGILSYQLHRFNVS